MPIYQNYVCAAYNCLILIFICTQSNKDHFKNFILQNNKQALWDNLVDPAQTEFGFEVVTDFQVVSPYAPLQNKTSQVKARIEKKYI